MDTDTAADGAYREESADLNTAVKIRNPEQPAVNPNIQPDAEIEIGYSTADRAVPRPLRSELRRLITNTLPLAASDLTIAVLIFLASSYISGMASNAALQSARFAILLPAIFVSLALSGTYPGVGLDPVAELRRLWIGTTGLMTALFASLAMQTQTMAGASWFVIIAWVLLLVCLPLGRAAVRSWLAKTNWWGEPVLVLGAGAAGRRVYDSIIKQASRGIRPLGIVDTANEMWRESEPAAKSSTGTRDLRIGLAEELPALAERLHVHWAVIAHSDDPSHPTRDDWLDYTAGIPHVLMETGDASTNSWTSSRECGTSHALYRPDQVAMGWPGFVKRVMDITIILMFTVAVIPLLGLLALLVKTCSPEGPVFYGQRRIGRYGKAFTAWKFRTMVPDAESLLSDSLAANPALQEEWVRDQKLRHDPRVIPGVGRFLRKTSLDELPQLWNVLCGEMSLVGPRPLPLGEFSVYGGKNVYGHYALVRPGITGMWQISGRNDLQYDEKPMLDEYYVRNWSPWLDVYILGRTVRTVIFREGAY